MCAVASHNQCSCFGDGSDNAEVAFVITEPLEGSDNPKASYLP
jgi:hypothetical protein